MRRRACLRYTVTAGLDTSAGRHNAVMAAGCGLSHQCPGEPALGARETAAGVHWTAAGENIGEGGPVAGTEAAIAQMAVGLTQSMLNEKPPDDGHRLNILSSAFTPRRHRRLPGQLRHGVADPGLLQLSPGYDSSYRVGGKPSLSERQLALGLFLLDLGPRVLVLRAVR